jgi:hypothetical protein
VGCAFSTHGREEKCIKDLVGKPGGKRSQGKPRRRWNDIEWILKKQNGRVWTGLMWLGIGTNSGIAEVVMNLLFVYNKIWGTSLPTEQLLAS